MRPSMGRNFIIPAPLSISNLATFPPRRMHCIGVPKLLGNSVSLPFLRPQRFGASFSLSSGCGRPGYVFLHSQVRVRKVPPPCILLRQIPSGSGSGSARGRLLRYFGSKVDDKQQVGGCRERVAIDRHGEREVLPRGHERDSGRSDNDNKAGHGMTKGKLLTTPSRLFKLILPLSTLHRDAHHKDIEPIAILLHHQQPLSHLERLIQSEVSLIKGENGQWRAPAVSFIALQLDGNSIRPRKMVHEGHNNSHKHRESLGQKQRSPKRHNNGTYSSLRLREQGEGTGNRKETFVRWSLSTEIGDFVRDAAHAREFIVTIEGAPSGLGQIHIIVPSFSERTYFLRMRLRKIARRLKSIAEVKHECDVLAQRGAQRVAISGFFVLSVWWYFVYIMTFRTNLGWDTMEPVTYLVSLSSLMGGYLWFLYHNREISYKSALDITISARQKRLYHAKGVDLQLWETLIDEGKTLRNEIKSIAAEYDVDWDERVDEQNDEQVTQALKRETSHHKNDVSEASDDNEGDYK